MKPISCNFGLKPPFSNSSSIQCILVLTALHHPRDLRYGNVPIATVNLQYILWII